MSVLTVVAKVVAKDGAIEQLKVELLKLVEPTRQEAGCIEYRLHQDCDDPAVFTFYENWESYACLEQHLNSKHFQVYMLATVDLIAEKSVNKLEEITRCL